jgi:membrane associated rhomboid family serine protease
MLPLKDNLPHARVPLLTGVLIVAALAGYLLPSKHWSLIATLLDILFLALLAPSVEGRLGPARFVFLCGIGSLLALALRAFAFPHDAPGALAIGSGGATVAALGAYAVMFPRGRVFTLVLVPFFAGVVELPAALLLGVWATAQLYLGLAG